MNKKELINFMMWFQSNTSHLNYDPVTAVERYLEFIKSDAIKERRCYV